MSERERDDGRCCEGGYFGTTHDCRKSDDKREAREWHVSEIVSAVVHQLDHPLRFYEKSAFDAMKANCAALKLGFESNRRLVKSLTEDVIALHAENERLKAEVDELRERLSAFQEKRLRQERDNLRAALSRAKEVIETLKVAVNDKVSDPGATAFCVRSLEEVEALEKGEGW